MEYLLEEESDAPTTWKQDSELARFRRGRGTVARAAYLRLDVTSCNTLLLHGIARIWLARKNFFPKLR